MKAIQAGKQPINNFKDDAVKEDLKPCHSCGKKSHPWGYYQHGNIHVCSKACSLTYLETRR
jgi:hypothetical protein